MSVINKMLRDLDKQQQQPQTRGFVSFKPQRKSQWLVWAAVPLALLAGWWGQAWYLKRIAITTPQAVLAAEVPKDQPNTLAALTELMPAVQNLAASTAPAAATEQAVSLQDIVANRVLSETAAESPGTPAPQAAVADQLQAFASRAVAEPRVVPVQILEPAVEDSSSDSAAELLLHAEVQISEFDQAAEFVPEQDTLLETQRDQQVVVENKPRSLAIEKVQLSPEQQKDRLVQQAKKAESVGNLQQAVSGWQQIRQLEPGSSQAYLELSRLAQVQRNAAGAVQILEQARAAGVQDTKVFMALAALAVKQQQWSKALSYLEGEPELSEFTDFYALKAAALQKTHQHAQSVQVFQQLARQQPDQARWWLGMALSFDAMQQQPQALLAYRQARATGAGLSSASLDYVNKRIAALE